MSIKLTREVRNAYARKNRETLLKSYNSFFILSILFNGVINIEYGLLEIGIGYMVTFVVIVSTLLLSTKAIYRISYFKLAIIDPLLTALIFLILERLTYLFL